MTVTTSASFNIPSDGVEGKHGVIGKKQQQQQTSPSSPLRSRRALPSLSVGAANDDTLKGRQGIVYIQNTKMPQDGWYQRVSETARAPHARTRGDTLFSFVV